MSRTVLSRTWPLILCCLLALGSMLQAQPVLASSEGGHGAEPKGWIATDTYRVINFAILAIGLFLLLRKPVSQALGARIKGIREQLAELEERKAEAEQQLEEYNRRLAQLDQEAEKIVAQYVQQGQEAKAKIIRVAEEAAVRLEEQAKRNIEHEFTKVKHELQNEIVERALVKAEEIIGKRITEADQNRLVDEYLQKVVA